MISKRENDRKSVLDIENLSLSEPTIGDACEPMTPSRHVVSSSTRNSNEMPSLRNAMFQSFASLPSHRMDPFITLKGRMSSSDGNVRRGTSTFESSVSRANFSLRATVLIAQRSNAAEVKAMVSVISQKCDAATSLDSTCESDIPFPECVLLSEIAKDGFYRVVIGSAGGVATLVKVMKKFPDDASLQEVCCTALGYLCQRNGSNQLAVRKENAISQICAAMRRHPSSIALQSAACDALRNMSVVILEPSTQPSEKVKEEMIELLTKASGMYITHISKENAEQLLEALKTTNAPMAA